MDTLKHILQSRAPQEPPEVVAIKDFVQANYGKTVSVQSGQRDIIVGVSSAALAGALRPRIIEMQSLCGTTKRIIIRIQ